MPTRPPNKHHPTPIDAKLSLQHDHQAVDDSEEDSKRVSEMIRTFCEPIDRHLPGGKVSSNLRLSCGGKKNARPGPRDTLEEGEIEDKADRSCALAAKPPKIPKNHPPGLKGTEQPRPTCGDPTSERKSHLSISANTSRKRRSAEELIGVSSDEVGPPLRKVSRKASASRKQTQDKVNFFDEDKASAAVSPQKSITITRKRTGPVKSTGRRSSITPSPTSDGSLDHHSREILDRSNRKSPKRKRRNCPSSRVDKCRKTDTVSPINLTAKSLPKSRTIPNFGMPRLRSVRLDGGKPPKTGETKQVSTGSADHSFDESNGANFAESDLRSQQNKSKGGESGDGLSSGRERCQNSDDSEKVLENLADWPKCVDRSKGVPQEKEYKPRKSSSTRSAKSDWSTLSLNEEYPVNCRDSMQYGKNTNVHPGQVKRDQGVIERFSEDGQMQEVTGANKSSFSGSSSPYEKSPTPDHSSSFQKETCLLLRRRSRPLEMESLFSERQKLEAEYSAAKDQLEELLNQKKYDEFEETARRAFRLGFEIGLSMESELRLEKQLKGAKERKKRKREITDHYKYLTQKLVSHCVADLERAGRVSALPHFRRGIQKVYLRMFIVQRIWDADQRTRESDAARVLDEMLLERREGNESKVSRAKLSMENLQSLKDVTEGFSNIISVYESAIHSSEDSCEEAGNECSMQ